MRLADFILANTEPILLAWEEFARSLSHSDKMAVLELRDHAGAILRACVRDMRIPQSELQQVSKSQGQGGAAGPASDRLDDASVAHGVGRVGSGFNLNEVVSEYRALRASVLGLWRQDTLVPDAEDLNDITRFNEAIDQSLARAVASYTHRVDQSRRMFLAILGHDLRNPLNCISMAAQLASIQHADDPESTEALSQIETSVAAISRLVKDLLDFAATGLGGRMPLVLDPVDLETLGREVLAELRTANPASELRFDARGDLTCACDASRMRQVLSNLLGNALQHGAAGSAVELSMFSQGEDVTFAVRNQGRPIPPGVLPTLFDPLVRGTSDEALPERRMGSIGLGLYIAREIVTSHGGTVDVASSAESGTVFTVRLPRRQNER